MLFLLQDLSRVLLACILAVLDQRLCCSFDQQVDLRSVHDPLLLLLKVGLLEDVIQVLHLLFVQACFLALVLRLFELPLGGHGVGVNDQD